MSDETIGKTVYFTLDLNNPPKLSDEEQERLSAIRDEDIDFSDIPRQTDFTGWTRPGLFGGPAGAVRRAALERAAAEKKILMLDDDLAEISRALGESAPQKMNAVLREHAAQLLAKTA